MALFTRTAPTPAPAPLPAPETWTPEGTLVPQRYRALEGAIVLVYTADADRGTAHYAAACLGCTYRADVTAAHNLMSEAEAAKAANAHASVYRAMPRGVPARPEDPEAVELTRTRLASRLRNIGLPSEAGRCAALLDLCTQMPPAVLQRLLGISPMAAERWSAGAVRMAYAAEVARRS
ncbi:hypothetical protein [Streptomyces sp. NPDC014623]|uniref:hypothetical protein n=1 Tax=Streptomyces sp. NPDC014623 TaxID=3364875 RepID=UPI0036F670B7